MQERGEVGNLRRRHVELRHAAIRPPHLQELAELAAVLVVLDEGRSREVGAARAAAGVGAVAEAALLRVETLPALDRGRIAGRRQRLLLGANCDGGAEDDDQRKTR